MAKGQGYRARLSKRIHRLFRSRRASSRRSSTGGQAAPPATSHASPRAIAPHSVAAHPPTDRPPVLPEPRSSPLSLGDQPGTKPKKLQKRRPSEESEQSLRDQERLAHVVEDIHGQLQTPDVIDGYDDDDDNDYEGHGRTPTRVTSYPFGGAGTGRGPGPHGGRQSGDSRGSPGRTSGRFVGAHHPAVHPLQAQPVPRSPPRVASAGAVPSSPRSDRSSHQRRRSKSSSGSGSGSGGSGRHRGKMTPYDQLHNSNSYNDYNRPHTSNGNSNSNGNGTYDYLNGAGGSPKSASSASSPSRSSYSGTAHLAPTKSRSSRHATPSDRHSARSLSWGPLSKHGRSRDDRDGRDDSNNDAPELPGFPGVEAGKAGDTVDYRVSARDAVVHEHIRPHVHTIYEPQRTRSIHYHDHYTLIQPVIDPVPRVMPERHWLQDSETGETTLITAEIGRALDLEGATTSKRQTRKAAPAADGSRSVYV